MIVKSKTWKKNSDLKQKFVSLIYQNNELEKDNRKLIIKCKDQFDSLVKFTKSETTLNKMLGENQSSLNKHGLGYNRNFPKISVTTFVKAKKHWHTPTCFYCCKKGHTKITCPYKRRDPQTIKNTYPVNLRDQVKHIWIVKGTRPPNLVHPEYDSKFIAWSRQKG